jgi:hypothetical protein
MSLVGKGQITTLTGATVAISALTSYISPNLQSAALGHISDVKPSKGQAGQTSALFNAEEILELTIEAIPEGTTVANAKTSAGLPPPLSAVTLTGFPVVIVGNFADAFNGTNWIYEGGGKINAVNDDKWTMTLPLKRYAGISSAAAIS